MDFKIIYISCFLIVALFFYKFIRKYILLKDYIVKIKYCIREDLETLNNLFNINLYKINHPFFNSIEKILEKDFVIDLNKLNYLFGKLKFVISDFKDLTKKERDFVIKKILSDKTETGFNGICAEMYIASLLKRKNKRFTWNEHSAEILKGDFSIGPNNIEVTTIELKNNNKKTISFLEKNIKGKIRRKNIKKYAKPNSVLVIFINSYVSNLINFNNNSNILGLIKSWISDTNFGYIVLCSNLIKNPDIETNNALITVGFKKIPGKNLSNSLRALINDIFPENLNDKRYKYNYLLPRN